MGKVTGDVTGHAGQAAAGDAQGVVDHFFRHESGKLVATLTRIFGLHNLELAEDVVQDALHRALEVWKLKGIPENPSAWLTRVARNRAIDLIRKDGGRRSFAPDLDTLQGWTLSYTVDAHFDASEIHDDQLRMMFACCHPRIPAPAQIAIILKVLCGFSVAEIARAFLATPASIEKRITRARSVMKKTPGLPEVSGQSAIRDRLPAVQAALYLLFNDGYHGSHPERAIRDDLCREAIRLAILLAEHPATGDDSDALVALMCFHASRLAARIDDAHHLVLLADQDRSAWDHNLIARGAHYLTRSGVPDPPSAWQLEAAIAGEHCMAPDFAATRWDRILGLYDRLLALRPSPVVALNRAIALAEVEGPAAGLAALQALAEQGQLATYPFLPAAMGELCRRLGRDQEASAHFEAAGSLARNPQEREVFRRKAGCRAG